MPAFSTAKWIMISIAAAALVGAILYGIHLIKQSGRDEANAACLVNSVKDAEAARAEVEKVKADAKAESDRAKEERDRQSKEDDERRAREQSERDAKLADWLSLQRSATPECKQWQSEPYACRTK